MLNGLLTNTSVFQIEIVSVIFHFLGILWPWSRVLKIAFFYLFFLRRNLTNEGTRKTERKKDILAVTSRTKMAPKDGQNEGFSSFSLLITSLSQKYFSHFELEAPVVGYNYE